MFTSHTSKTNLHALYKFEKFRLENNGNATNHVISLKQTKVHFAWNIPLHKVQSTKGHVKLSANTCQAKQVCHLEVVRIYQVLFETNFYGFLQF